MKALEEATNELQECLRKWKKEREESRYSNMVITAEEDAEILSTLESLLEKGANFKHLETNRGFGCIPNVFWCQRLIKFFLDKGADINSRDDNGDTVLHLAIRYGNFYSIPKYIRLHGGKFDGKAVCPKNTPLDVIKYVLGQSADPNIANLRGETPVFTLAKRSSTRPEEENSISKIAKMLIDKGGDVTTCNSDGESLLHIVCSSKDLVDAALQGAANLDELRTSSWLYAQTPLMVAAKEGRLEDCQMLVKRGADPKATDLQGYTALHHAVSKGQYECAHFLVKKKNRKEPDQSDTLIKTKSESGRDCHDLGIYRCYDNELLSANDVAKTKWLEMFEMRGVVAILKHMDFDECLRQWKRVTHFVGERLQPPSQEFVANHKYLIENWYNYGAMVEIYPAALNTVARLSADEHSKFWNYLSCVPSSYWMYMPRVFYILDNLTSLLDSERITEFASLEEMDFESLLTLVRIFEGCLSTRRSRLGIKADLFRRISQFHAIARLVIACFNKLTHVTKSNKLSSTCTQLYVVLCHLLTSLHSELRYEEVYDIPKTALNENERLLRSLIELDLRDWNCNSFIHLMIPRIKECTSDLIPDLLEFVNVKSRNAMGFEPIQMIKWENKYWPRLILKLLADKGCHVDAKNVTRGEPSLRDVFQDIGEPCTLAFHYDNLQCACARVLAGSVVPYANRVPKHVVDFINSH